MAYYNINYDPQTGVLMVGFGEPAQNDAICREAAARLKELTSSGVLAGGDIIKINGPASLPVAVVIAHEVVHRYQAVAVYDPKLGKYVVAVSHSPQYKVGDLID
jgi:CRISPR-associated protein Csx3